MRKIDQAVGERWQQTDAIWTRVNTVLRWATIGFIVGIPIWFFTVPA